ncbi:methylmalonyl-CoA mutase [Xylophilus sp. GOD-11R]|uniref:methylmalonyl-CoA mutase n=1 Tax=Xylophilus sp. GOD-11R TaxID=3089814 RepID=UPI00298CF2C9|nr:methylmalonyl-CoA mutase [Xylophilus sp. GOD-11R]WPB55610.1 methylmalonyl-CoA mutase [Xylophilus sp. GOD-11R]
MNPESKPADHAAWRAAVAPSAPGGDPSALARHAGDGLVVQPLYTAADTAGLPHLDTLPGFAPFVRGPQPGMHATRPWTIRQYAGFSTARETNTAYRQALAGGAQGISVAFDLPTHRGYDSDHPEVAADVGQAGVAIDSVEDMAVLFEGIPLARVSVSLTMSGAVLPVLAAFIVAAEEQGVPQAALTGTIQNDILKEFLVRNTYIYPPTPSMRIVGDIVAHTAAASPRFNAISISGYHLQEAGAEPALALALTLADGMEYVRTALARGLDVDAFAGRLSFFFGVGMDFYVEIAKLRAARLLWCRVMQGFGAREPRSLVLRTHCQTSGASLTGQDPHNNIVRTTVEAMAAVFGGTQSLHTNAFDEAVSLPTEAAARVALATQLILRDESRIGEVIDPWAGSYLMEKLTHDMADAAWKIVEEIEAQGGMARVVDSGWAGERIEAAAAAKQARIDAGREIVVGVNRHRPRIDEPIASRAIDADGVREAQTAALRALRARRDAAAVDAALSALADAAGSGAGNLLALAIVAMRVRATVGEVSHALEQVWGRHGARARATGGAYAAACDAGDGSDDWQRLRAEARALAGRLGRAPRLLVAKLGQDGHDRGAKVVGGAFADLGFEVEMGPLFQRPDECARQAVAFGAHAIGVSTLAAGHRALVPALMRALRVLGADHVLVFVGGVVPREDHEMLYDCGVQGIYGPGTPIPASARDVMERLRQADRHDGRTPGRHPAAAASN